MPKRKYSSVSKAKPNKGFRKRLRTRGPKSSGTKWTVRKSASRRRAKSRVTAGRGGASSDGKVVIRNPMKNKVGMPDQKVSREFRKKVKLASEEAKPKGWSTEIYWEKFKNLTFDNFKQRTAYLPLNNNLNGLFDPDFINDAASILWNKKPCVTWASKFSGGLVGNFLRDALDLYVNNSYVDYTIKNNTHRTYTIKLYECAPKKSLVYDIASPTDPIGTWQAALAEQGSNPLEGGPNVSNIDETQLMASPKMVSSFNAAWTTKVSTIVLQPGQSTKVRVQGPKNLMLHYSKFYNGLYFVKNQPFVRYAFMTYYADIVGAKTASVEMAGLYYPAGEDSVTTHGLLVQASSHYDLRMPENAGFSYPTVAVANATQQLNFRRDAFNLKSFLPTDVEPTVIGRIDDEAPNEDEDLS